MSHIRSKSKWLHRKRKSVCQRQSGKKLRKQRGAKSAEVRGLGAGSRKKFTLPAKWRQLVFTNGGRKRVEFESPGKTIYKTQKEVEKTLVKRNMKECLDDRSSTEESIPQDESSEWECEPANDEKGVQKLSKTLTSDDTETNSLERRFFVCESTQLMDLVHQVNKTSQCSTKDCNGKRLCSAN